AFCSLRGRAALPGRARARARARGRLRGRATWPGRERGTGWTSRWGDRSGSSTEGGLRGGAALPGRARGRARVRARVRVRVRVGAESSGLGDGVEKVFETRHLFTFPAGGGAFKLRCFKGLIVGTGLETGREQLQLRLSDEEGKAAGSRPPAVRERCRGPTIGEGPFVIRRSEDS